MMGGTHVTEVPIASVLPGKVSRAYAGVEIEPIPHGFCPEIAKANIFDTSFAKNPGVSAANHC